MATRKKSDDEKTAGADQSKDVETTKEAEEREVPEAAEERGKTDPEAAASGSVVGGVVDGDSGLEDAEEAELPVADGKVEGGLGVVAERNVKGEERDVPWTYLTASNVARTSDSDDPQKSWTVQEAAEERKDEDGKTLDPVALTPVQATPGQTFRVSELPNVEVVKAAGIDHEQWFAGLPVRPDVEDEAPRKGIPA